MSEGVVATVTPTVPCQTAAPLGASQGVATMGSEVVGTETGTGTGTGTGVAEGVQVASVGTGEWVVPTTAAPGTREEARWAAARTVVAVEAVTGATAGAGTTTAVVGMVVGMVVAGAGTAVGEAMAVAGVGTGTAVVAMSRGTLACLLQSVGTSTGVRRPLCGVAAGPCLRQAGAAGAEAGAQ